MSLNIALLVKIKQAKNVLVIINKEAKCNLEQSLGKCLTFFVKVFDIWFYSFTLHLFHLFHSIYFSDSIFTSFQHSNRYIPLILDWSNVSYIVHHSGSSSIIGPFFLAIWISINKQLLYWWPGSQYHLTKAWISAWILHTGTLIQSNNQYIMLNQTA